MKGKQYFVMLSTDDGRIKSGLYTPKYTDIQAIQDHLRLKGYEFEYADPLQVEFDVRRRPDGNLKKLAKKS